MNDTNIFPLAQVIKAAGSDPSKVTEAVWEAGYRRPERPTEEAVSLTLEILCGCYGADIPWEVWPKDYSGVLKEELNECVFPAMTDGATAFSAAKALIAAGYTRKEATSD
ncbi:hypothetical protein EHW66_21435 [Erwinia psidii]|uniref:hypothetical protein n=1 Tax=Erwinia psidii TaxID=69224 RepID=UPI00226B0213|nr:hypothetical protein [Erwinia psidii]MCX8967430.1 hypothetical protein [Erwinia psidii]